MLAFERIRISLAIVDIVTNRTANLHNEWIDFMQAATGRMHGAPQMPLYANAYRPVRRDSRDEIDMWLNSLQIGQLLPSLPLFLRADLCIELELQDTYVETCGDQRIAAD